MRPLVLIGWYFFMIFFSHGPAPEYAPGTGRTIGDLLAPKIPALYSGKTLPALLSENPT